MISKEKIKEDETLPDRTTANKTYPQENYHIVIYMKKNIWHIY